MATGHYVLLGLLLAAIVLVAMSWTKVMASVAGLREFFREVNFEMGKVTWPSTEEIVNSTVLVFIVIIALTVMVMLVDGAFARIFGMLLLGGGQS
ncbi:preprotein translocase subunit SecE [bacterium]|nr:preprotein translocase subunit SecE [bacterium]